MNLVGRQYQSVCIPSTGTNPNKTDGKMRSKKVGESFGGWIRSKCSDNIRVNNKEDNCLF